MISTGQENVGLHWADMSVYRTLLLNILISKSADMKEGSSVQCCGQSISIVCCFILLHSLQYIVPITCISQIQLHHFTYLNNVVIETATYLDSYKMLHIVEILLCILIFCC